MEISRPGAKAPTPEQSQGLEKLKVALDRAVADGKVSDEEMRQFGKKS